MLKYCNLEAFSYNKMLLLLPYYVATACVNRKVSVTSNNHMMHPLTISGNIGMLWLTVLKISGGLGVTPPEAVRFLQSKDFKIP